MNGKISSFQSLGTLDGPGLRTVVFMQGCPLRCICCHNPETWDFNAGMTISADDLVEKILRYKEYIKDGGTTFSGGEPIYQAKFVAEVFRKLHDNNIHTCLDTSGCIYNDDIDELLNNTDLVLLDYKYSTDEAYKKYVGCSVSAPTYFLEKLEEKNIKTWLRRVIIPKINDDDFSYSDIENLKKTHSCVEKIEYLPLSLLCKEKYENMGIDFPVEHLFE
jgi:pyruvate formate lyase activating enzyme